MRLDNGQLAAGSRFRLPAMGTGGFTLLETMIAVTIMLVAFSSILAVESASLNASAKAKLLNVASMLAKNAMVDAEFDVEGKTFEEVKKEDGGQFKEPFQDYSWKREIKEVKFPNLAMGGGGSGAAGDGGDEGGQTQAAETFGKLLTQFLSKAVREIVVTVSWKRGQGEQSLTLSTYWVDLNHEFQLSQ